VQPIDPVSTMETRNQYNVRACGRRGRGDGAICALEFHIEDDTEIDALKTETLSTSRRLKIGGVQYRVSAAHISDATVRAEISGY
jgi:hypothetical protein